jgi:hypothetical protein
MISSVWANWAAQGRKEKMFFQLFMGKIKFKNIVASTVKILELESKRKSNFINQLYIELGLWLWLSSH